jgi:hypothetical protein
MALLLAIGTTAICAAKTFVYVSNALVRVVARFESNKSIT